MRVRNTNRPHRAPEICTMGGSVASFFLLGRRLHIAEFIRIPWPLGGLRVMAEGPQAGEGTIRMFSSAGIRSDIRLLAAALPLALAAALAVSPAASAQTPAAPAPAPAKPAAAAPKPAPA